MQIDDFDIKTSSDDEENVDYITGEKCEITIGFFYAAPDTYSERYLYLSEQTLRKMLEVKNEQRF
ncbi:hypothetical protein [Dolichospermum sp. LEGE 00246]|uniref:hypothetical protein n=1 Tax=Dolichospermum sp. LEGE 00246 TaxID=1828605 RepID=UPI00187FC3A7|nr:hypothetical protein [Dolichospermum sp. LEGE 00246]MBE9256591.1 hypothetical protein [Dolichospermum sp. LEGE 00246]